MKQPEGELARALLEAIGPQRHLGVQLYVSVRGRPVFDLAAGRRDDGTALDPDDLLVWFSAGKPLVAAAVCQLWQDGLIDLDEPVATYLPAFAAGGKAAITTRHLLTHSGGRMSAPGPPGSGIADPFAVDYEPAIGLALAAELHPEDRPGEQPSYSASVLTWLVLSQLVRHHTGARFDDVVAERIGRPLGMETHYGFTESELSELGNRVCTFVAPRTGLYLNDADAREGAAIREVMAGGTFHRTVDPGAGLWASARSLGRFYELLCARAVGGSWAPADGVLDERTVAEMVKPQRPSFFEEAPLIDFGLGLTLETRRLGPQYAYFGSSCSFAAFGHQGHGAPMAFADPRHDLVVSFNGNGLPGRVLGKRIWQRISDAVYEELGLTLPDEPARADGPRPVPRRRLDLRPPSARVDRGDAPTGAATPRRFE
ncbi:serine hydrolase domain-containing protein [Streptomyces sp. NRRL WC-3725]|uniref:serine hydrolase domain-containing protein n=1 Tax=Streptomyces sp. NRRL WC-3725 TaxID=1463933 RepID=UPI0004CC6D82|nr:MULTISPECIES: serine hydrolase domain-containing protein [Streptomyces]KOG70084.1 hypothetical protein ADK77_12710 [Streptomyces antibioticus]